MPASLSPLRLKHYYLKELSYILKDSLESDPPPKTDDKTVDLEIGDLTTPIPDSEDEWRCELTIKSTNPEAEHFYEFRIRMVGFFSVDSKGDPEFMSTLVKTNAPAVLYSASREIVATVTRRSPYPGTLLPAVTFYRPPESPETPPASASAKARPKSKSKTT